MAGPHVKTYSCRCPCVTLTAGSFLCEAYSQSRGEKRLRSKTTSVYGATLLQTNIRIVTGYNSFLGSFSTKGNEYER